MKVKVFKKKGYQDTTLRSIMDENKTQCLGIIGTVKDLMHVGILEFCNAKPDIWCCVYPNGKAIFTETKLELFVECKFEKV